METLQETAQLITSKPVQRAVVSTVLLFSGAATLLGFAAIASALFFQNFLPHQVVTTPVYLQYGFGVHPYGIASISTPPMMVQQEYDLSLTLSMPRSVPNLDQGNFMVSLHLLDATADGRLDTSAQLHAAEHGGFGETKVLYSSRRPALLPYVDPFVSYASRILFLLYHLLAPGSSTTDLVIPLAERVWFPKGSKIPGSAYVEVEAGQSIQVYHATLRMTAQLRGLRWLMVHYRISTYLAFTMLFWVCEMVFMGFTWVIYTSMMDTPADTKGLRLEGGWRRDVKDEEGYEETGEGEESEDRPETFPTYGRQPPLKYEPKMKQEALDEPLLSELPREGAEADDEDEDEDEEEVDEYGHKKDSGIGTSYDEEGSGKIRRRRSGRARE